MHYDFEAPISFQSSIKFLLEYICSYLTDITRIYGDHGSTVVKVLFYRLEVRWFDPN